jgi:hypothetical protein
VAVIGTVFFDAIGAGTTFPAAMRTTTGIAAAIAAATLLVVFTLPKQARPETE